MATIIIGPVAALELMCVEYTPAGVVSFMKKAPRLSLPQLMLPIDDIVTVQSGQTLAEEGHLRQFIQFLTLWDFKNPLVFHCLMGLSRSPAGALVALALWHFGREAEATAHFFRTLPHARPNLHLIALGDKVLGCQGRLVEAVKHLRPSFPSSGGEVVSLPVHFS